MIIANRTRRQQQLDYHERPAAEVKATDRPRQVVFCKLATGRLTWWQASRWTSLLLLLGAFRIRRLGLLVGVLRMLLRLGGVFLAFGMVIPAVRLRGGAMGLCGGLVKFRGLVV
jgi:hypothetical protein